MDKLLPPMVLAAGLALAAGSPAHAQEPSGPVVAIVRVAKPWYAPRALVASRMRDTIDQYAQLPGLLFKAYSFEQASGDFGGIYAWRDRPAAQTWFNDAWFERIRRERGVQAQVRLFDAPVSLDNTPGGAPADNDSRAVATLVEIPIPAGLPRARLEAEFATAVPAYRKVPGLLRKHFIVSDAGTFGGVYLWADEASARAWFNAAWHQRVSQTYGRDARIEWFDTPILLPTRLPANQAVAGTLGAATP